jgi:hypothetical protein
MCLVAMGLGAGARGGEWGAGKTLAITAMSM